MKTKIIALSIAVLAIAGCTTDAERARDGRERLGVLMEHDEDCDRRDGGRFPKIDCAVCLDDAAEGRLPEQRQQSQMSLTDQLESLYVLANRWGYYDAADFIRRLLDAGKAAG